MANVADLIRRSETHDEIAHADWTPELARALAAECDDSCDLGSEIQYWADAPDSDGNDGKMAWRVHLHGAVTDMQIKALRSEAGSAGDLEQVAICDRALRGDDDARAECARVIADAAAQVAS